MAGLYTIPTYNRNQIDTKLANLSAEAGFQWSASNTNGRLLNSPTIGAGAGHTTNQSTSVRITRIL